MSDSMHDEAHTGPIKTPKQLLIAVLFSFLVPVAIIVALVAYVVADNKPSGVGDAERYILGGVSAQDLQRGVAERVAKVGVVEIRDANRPLANGETVFKAQCAACHTTGAANAPKLGEPAAWADRLKQGFDALVASALKGKGAMPPQGGGDYTDVEIARAVAYLANSAGAKFAEPAAPAAPAAADAAAPAAAAAPAPAAAPAAPAAPAAAAAPAPAAPAATATVAAGAGQALYNQSCALCHATGVANAPKLGDKAAWAPRLAQGLPGLTQSVIRGKGAMPPRGGSTASDAQLQAAVEYMLGTVR